MDEPMNSPTRVPSAAEPTWLTNLRRALELAGRAGLPAIAVRAADLEMAVGRCGNGPGGEVLITATREGLVLADFQGLIRAVYMTPDEAVTIVAALLSQADLARSVRWP